MPGHLTEEQWNAGVLGTTNETVRAHIENCAECQGEERELEGAFAALRDSLSSESERPEAFWQRQRVTISARVSQQRHAERGLVWATALAALALVATMFIGKAPSTQVAAPESDEALLMDVERSVERGVPEALAPAALLTQEISRARQPQKNPDSKHSASTKGEHRP